MNTRETYRGVNATVHYDYVTDTFIASLDGLPMSVCIEASTREEVREAMENAIDEQLGNSGTSIRVTPFFGGATDDADDPATDMKVVAAA